MQRRSSFNTEIARIEQALETVAKLVAVEAVYAPIFLRLEHEIVRSRVTTDAISRARAIAEAYKQPRHRPPSDTC